MYIGKIHIILIFITAKLLATAFSLYIVDQFTPLVDAKLYQGEKYYDHVKIPLRTLLTQFIASITNFLTSPMISHYIFSIFSVLGILWYIKSNRVTWHILCILLLPTSMIWTSVIGKESIYYCLFSILLINWNSYINKQFKFSNYLIVFIISIICFILRPHYLVPIVWLFWSAIIISNFKNYLHILISTFLILCVLLYIIFIFGHYIDHTTGLNFFDVKWRAYTSIDPSSNASRHEALKIVIPPNLCANEACDFIKEKQLFLINKFSKYFSLGFFFGVIGPLPIETIKRPEFIPFFIEGIIILLMPVVFFILCRFNKNFSWLNVYFKNYLFGIIPAIFVAMSIHAYFGILNPGTAIRWRINFELIFYFAPYLIYLNLKEIKNEKNSTLSP